MIGQVLNRGHQINSFCWPFSTEPGMLSLKSKLTLEKQNLSGKLRIHLKLLAFVAKFASEKYFFKENANTKHIKRKQGSVGSWSFWDPLKLKLGLNQDLHFLLIKRLISLVHKHHYRKDMDILIFFHVAPLVCLSLMHFYLNIPTI